MPDIQSPTLIIGLGGTGVAVLRKFKQRYIELYKTDERLIKLLAIDTADQSTDSSNAEGPPLSPQEFYQLGDPPISVNEVVQQARTEPALDWLRRERVPGFEIKIGAGMKRLYGHIAYFFRGAKIRKRLEEAVNKLMNAAGGLGELTAGTGFRVFIVSSLCGGTGTGMFLDIAYMVDDVVRSAGLGSPHRFGLLFLPSAFQDNDLQRNRSSVEGLNANAYAALRELNYYMTIKEQDRSGEYPTLDMPDSRRTSIPVREEPFQYCYLVGGVNEAGIPVKEVRELYDRTAEFLFMTATSDIGKKLAESAVNGRECFAGFGSCNLQLPQSRSLQKYFLLMGREILDDIFGDPGDGFAPPNVAERFAGIPGYAVPLQLASDAAVFLEEEVFVRYNMHGVDSRQASTTINNVVAQAKSAEAAYHDSLLERAAQVGKEILSLAHREIASAWNLEVGTIHRTIRVIDISIATLGEKRTALQARGEIPEYDFQSPSVLSRLLGKGDAQLASFRKEIVSIFEARAQAAVAAEYIRLFAAISTELQQFKEKLIDLSRLKLEKLDKFKTAGEAYITAIGQEQHNLGLLDPLSVLEDDDYKSDRVGLLNRCRADIQIRAAIGSSEKPTVSLDALIGGLFPVVEKFVEQKAFRADFIDNAFYQTLAKAKINVQLKQRFKEPHRSSLLFVNGSDELKESLTLSIANAPNGFPSPDPKTGVNPGSATFVQLVSKFEVKDLVDIDAMAAAYETRIQSSEGVFLNIPTHRRDWILDSQNENLGPELFAIACILSGVMEVGYNYLLKGRRLLISDEPDPVRRRKAAYKSMLAPDNRREVEQARDAAAENLGGNGQFVPFIQQQLEHRYLNIGGSEEYQALMVAEKMAAENYLKTLPVQTR